MTLAIETAQAIMQPFAQAGAPLGVSARYEPEYEFVEQEVAKLGGLDPNSVQWRTIAQQGSAILNSKSKDLAIACYVSVAWFVTEGTAGLASGLEVISWLLNDWEGIFPEKKRLRGRIAALQWLAGQLERELGTRKIPKGDSVFAMRSVENLEKIGEKLNSLLGSDAPNFAVSIRLLKAAANAGMKDVASRTDGLNTDDTAHPINHRDASDDESSIASSTNGSGTVSAKSNSALSIATPSDVPKVLRNVQDMLRQAAAVILAQKIEDVRAYRYIRIAAWLNIDSAPPAQNGVTSLRPVSSDVLAKSRSYLSSGDYRNLLIEVENSIARAPFWIDGHLMSFRALHALGTSSYAARDFVAREVGRFVERFPGIVELKFNDETPFVSSEARTWLDQEVKATLGGDSKTTVVPALPTATVASTQVAQDFDDPLKEVQELVSQGKFKEGMQKFSALQARTAPGRQKFLLQLKQARMCIEQQRADLALPQLEALEVEITQRHLDEWEPEITKDVLQLLLLCYERLGEVRKKLGTKKGDKIQEFYARLCRLDLACAMEMNDRASFKKLVDLAYEV